MSKTLKNHCQVDDILLDVRGQSGAAGANLVELDNAAKRAVA